MSFVSNTLPAEVITDFLDGALQKLSGIVDWGMLKVVQRGPYFVIIAFDDWKLGLIVHKDKASINLTSNSAKRIYAESLITLHDAVDEFNREHSKS